MVDSFNFADIYHQYDGYIYGKKGGKIENFLTSLGVLKSNMHKTMRNDGKHALKEYLPNICGVIKSNQDSSTIIETMNDYCRVFEGGVKDQFLQKNSCYAPGIWQEVKNMTHSLVLLPLS